MPTQDEFYGSLYARFGSAPATELRREVYGEDLGQISWLTATEQAQIAELLRLVAPLLGLAIGAGEPGARHRHGDRPEGAEHLVACV